MPIFARGADPPDVMLDLPRSLVEVLDPEKVASAERARVGPRADPRPAPQGPQVREHWFLWVTKKAITADYLVHHDTPSAARSNRTHLLHATCHRTKHPSRLAGNTVLQQTT
jgi:hypothetical protein